ncbi:MAG: DUF1080 domain-containing protein [Bryobacteraceae bacterium]|nr:DUF1080 domain-containing protein [Bryobacteraceae bacterium]
MKLLSRRGILGSVPFFGVVARGAEAGFRPLFDGRSLEGWRLYRGRGPGYVVEGGSIVCPADGGGNLYTEREFDDFTLRLEWRFWEGGNNGIGIRTPMGAHASTHGMEIQILDDESAKYKGRLKPAQYTGSVYSVVAARQGFVKRDGVWNTFEITAYGPRIHVVLNGESITDADLSQVRDREVLAQHPGIRRTKGHIALLGHGTHVEFRNLRVREGF